MHVLVKDLTQRLQNVLKSVNYHAKDIEVIPTSTVELNAQAWSNGARGFIYAVNLDTGQTIVRQGSWGGANPFEPSAVDLTNEVYQLPENGAIVKGSTGYPRTFAKVYVHPVHFARMLPEAAEELTEHEQRALYCHKCIKGGQYRRDELRRLGVGPLDVQSLIQRGYLSQNKAGATSITLKGKNAFNGRNY